jgi:hypothetical protein
VNDHPQTGLELLAELIQQAVVAGPLAEDALEKLEDAVTLLKHVAGRQLQLPEDLREIMRLFEVEAAGHARKVSELANESVKVALLVYMELEHPTRWESYPRKRRSDRESYSVDECIKIELAYRETNRGGRVALQARTRKREARIRAYLRARKALERRGALPIAFPPPEVALPPRGGEPLTAAPELSESDGSSPR